MQRFLVLAALLLAAGCMKEKLVEAEIRVNQALSPGCYTVDLFDPYEVVYPGGDVPAEYTNFLGVWKNGAWGGTWCQDLYITNVTADGTVTLLDAHGPNREQGYEATVFKRRGKIENGILTFNSVGGPVRYKRIGEYLVGERPGRIGKVEITMSREGGVALVPVPPRKPVRRT